MLIPNCIFGKDVVSYAMDIQPRESGMVGITNLV